MSLSLFRFTSICITTLLLFGCNQREDAISVAKEKTTGSEQVSEKKHNNKPLKLTNDNALGFLEDYGNEHSEELVRVGTRYGDMVIRLYKNTPLHRANFLYLTNQNYFNNTWFYRVSKGHVIQAGNTDAAATVKKRDAIGDYQVPNEMKEGNWHKRGAVAAARKYSNNPDKDSDPFEFYIVIGQSYTRGQLVLLAEKHEITLSDAQLDFYQNSPGSPHLDGEHTVFGEVIQGMDVVMKISQAQVDEGEWPLTNIPITTEILQTGSLNP